MSGVCGWAGARIGASEGRERLRRMALPLRGAGGPDAESHVATAAGLASVRPGGRGLASGPGGAVAITGHPWWEDGALARTSRERGPAAAFLEGFAEHGEDLLPRTRGDFAVAWVNDDALLLATDRCAVRPILFEERGGALRFGSCSAALKADRDGDPEVDPQAVYDFLYFGFVPGPFTAWRGRSRLEPGELLRFRGGRTERRAWWRPTYDETRVEPMAELSREARALLLEAVRRRAEGRVGAFLSGGLDSSTVAGMLARVRPEARTYSIGFDAPGYDEMEYARIAARQFGTVHREYYVTPDDVVKAIPIVAETYEEPFGNESAVPAYYCARLARDDGVECMLAGDGGDEIFAGNERYRTQQVFELWNRLPGVLRAVFEPVLARFPFGSRLSLVRKARSYVRKAAMRLPDRLQDYNLVEMLGPEAVFDAGFLQRVDTGRPLRLLRATWDAADAGIVNRMLALDWKFTLADCDLPKVCRMCERAGVDVTFPMLDDDLVDFASRLRPSLKLRRFRLRHFYKEAMKGFLPDAILRKRKHGFGLPFGVWLRSHAPLQAMAEESVDALRARDILNPGFVDRVVAAHRGEHAAYYGAMIWGLMMLEMWFRHHVDAAVVEA
mgnify:CR=1 FL=1